MSNFTEVIEKYNYLVENMPEKQFRYQVNSIYNFIIHFDEISDNSEREFVKKSLSEYLDYIATNEVNTNKACQDLFYEYILPVGYIYKKHASFQYVVRPNSIVVYLILANVMLLLFSLSYLYFLGLNVIGVLVFIWNYKRRRATRVYQVGW